MRSPRRVERLAISRRVRSACPANRSRWRSSGSVSIGSTGSSVCRGCFARRAAKICGRQPASDIAPVLRSLRRVPVGQRDRRDDVGRIREVRRGEVEESRLRGHHRHLDPLRSTRRRSDDRRTGVLALVDPDDLARTKAGERLLHVVAGTPPCDRRASGTPRCRRTGSPPAPRARSTRHACDRGGPRSVPRRGRPGTGRTTTTAGGVLRRDDTSRRGSSPCCRSVGRPTGDGTFVRRRASPPARTVRTGSTARGPGRRRRARADRRAR